jgi:Resolvase, N terminal domain.
MGQVSQNKSSKRVAVYCRVIEETDNFEPLLKVQITQLTDVIDENSAWELVGVYAEQITETDPNDQVEFNRLLTDCKNSCIDIVLVESMRQLCPNLDIPTMHAIYQQFSALGIEIWFNKEQLSSNDDVVCELFETYEEYLAHPSAAKLLRTYFE